MLYFNKSETQNNKKELKSFLTERKGILRKMNALIQQINRDIESSVSKLNIVNDGVEKYWKDILQANYDEEESDRYKQEIFDVMFSDKDNEEIAEEIFEIIFNSYSIEFDYEYYTDNLDEIYFPDIPLMINYFNTYYSENYGPESMESTDLDMDKIFTNYAFAYASYNGIKDNIQGWLDENLVQTIEPETIIDTA